MTIATLPWVTPSISSGFPNDFPAPIYTSWVERDAAQLQCFAQEHNTLTMPGLEPRPLDLGSSPLISRPLCLWTQGHALILEGNTGHPISFTWVTMLIRWWAIGNGNVVGSASWNASLIADKPPWSQKYATLIKRASGTSPSWNCKILHKLRMNNTTISKHNPNYVFFCPLNIICFWSVEVP